MHPKMDLGIYSHASQDGFGDLHSCIPRWIWGLKLMHPKMDFGIETHASQDGLGIKICMPRWIWGSK